MANTYKSGSHSRYLLQYHLIFVCKYRKKLLLYPFIIADIKSLSREICSRYNVVIHYMESDKDHIHILINCKPQHYIPDLIQKMKGKTSRILMEENREILSKKLWGGHLWNPSYFIATVSENTEEQIRKYIKNQKKK